MATNPFGFGPMGLPATQPEDPATKKARIDDLALKTRVPANVLLAFDERGEDVGAKAAEISGWINGGRRVEEVVPPDVMNRAYDIADALYPREAAPPVDAEQPSALADTGKQFGGALVRGLGGMVDATGAAIDTLITRGNLPEEGYETPIRSAARAVGAAISDKGASIQAGVSEEAKQAIAASSPGGDLFDPSTWTLGEAPSLRGYTLLAADVLGSFLPVVATAVVTKSPTAAAAVGGLQGGGAATQTARKTIEDMAASGVLPKESAYFRELVASGVPEAKAVEMTARAAEQAAFLMTTPISAFGGAATGKIIAPGIGALAGRGLASRAAGTAAVSALEEGAQEVAESVATKAGINKGAGTDLSLTEGTFADFILGAMGGGPVGAVSGAFNKETRDDGSVAGSAGVPETNPGAGAPATPLPGNALVPGLEGGAAMGQAPTPPAGPLSEIAALAPDLTPQPVAAPKFPDFKPGKEVRLVDPETGVLHNAVFLGESETGVTVRIEGGEVDLTPEIFDQARVAAIEADESAKPAKKGGKKGKAKGGMTAADAPPDVVAPEQDAATESPFDAPAQALQDAGFYDLGAAATPAGPVLPPETPPAMTPDEALKRAKIIEDTAKRGGWTPRLKAKHAEFMAIAGEAGNAQGAVGSDVVGTGDAATPGQQPDDQGGSQKGQIVAPVETAAATRSDAGDQPGVVPDGGAPGKRGEQAAVDRPRPQVSPITTAPNDRIQPDMLGGAATTETEMAAKERRRKEWGRFLGIVENGKSMDDSTLEGRDVLIRGAKVIIRAKNGVASDMDYRLDTEGMDRDSIAARVRGALSELDRRAPLPAPASQVSAAPVPPAAPSPPLAAGEAQTALETDSVALKDSKATLAKVNLLRWEDGWEARLRIDIQGNYGASIGVKGRYPTKEAAVAAAKAEIGEDVASIARTNPDGTTSAKHVAAAKRILKWAQEGKTSEAGAQGEPDAEPASANPQPGEVSASSAPATTGLLSVLSPEKQARAAELAKKLADKARNQVSSGLDPEYITLGGELVKLYLEAGVRKFGQMLKDFADQTGLTLKQAQEPMRAAYNHVRDNMEIDGESIDGMDDARAVLEEAKKAIQGDTPPPPASKPRDPVSANPNPTGQTYRLENALTTAERRVIATVRDQGAYVGEVFAELDNASRRADADMRSRGVDIAQADDMGNINGKPDQMAWFIREAEAHAKELVKQVKAEGAENVGPLDKDEDTGEWEYDGSALGNALEFLDQQYAMGLGVDEDVIPGPGGGDATAMDPEKVFPAPKGTRNIDSLVEQEGFIRKVEADARLAFWKKTAARIGKEGKNADKVILSLFDYKGTWSQPWVDAGYTVIRHDIKTGSDLITDQWIYDRITEIREGGKEVYGVLSACPCTTFTGSGARWWQERHDVESPDALAQVFGDRALSSGAKSALEYNIMLADATREAVRLANPTGFHVLENPIGRIQDKAKFPAPLARFHPHNFGDPYTKRTQLFGDFQADLPTANVQPVEGSKMQNSLRGSDPLGKEDRSTTPEGFAYAFFMANDPEARKVKDNTGTISGAVDRLSGDAVKGGDEISPPLSVEPAPVPQSAPWWDTADDLTRRAILKEAGLFQGADVADRFSAMSEGLRGKLTDAFGRLYRAKKIDNIGTTEAPRFALAGETIDATAVPTRAEVTAAAAETDPNPTPAQAEAENYKTGKIDWHGLTLSIENAKGSIRRKVTPDGKTAWEVKMPAHYGRILGTTGADGDHVDFYMGPAPDAEIVYVIDQRDAETGEFDEHKVMLGFKNQKAAKDAYLAGFSDGKGPLRLMSMTPMGYADLVMNLKQNPGIWKGPISATDAALPDAPAKPPKPKTTSPAANRAFPDFKGKLNGPYYDNRSDDGRFNEEKNAFHDAASTFLRATVKVLQGEGWTEAKTRPGRGGKQDPIKPVRSNRAGPAVLGEVSMTLMGPDGVNGAYVQIGESFSGGNRAQLMWRINHHTNPYGSGSNQFLDPTGMTPVELAEKLISAQARVAKQPDAKPAAPTAQDINKAMLDAAKASGRLEIIGMEPVKPAAEIDGSAFEAVGMVRGKDAASDSWFRKQAEGGGVAIYKARSVTDGWKLTRDITFPEQKLTSPPTRELGTFITPADAIAQLKENGMRTGVPEEPAAPAKPSSEKTWKDFDESSATDPKMPAGYELTAIRRLTRDEARSEGYQWPAMKAVVKRDLPYTYKVESAISEKSRSDAIARALRLAQKGAPGADGATDLPPTPAATAKDAEEFWDSLSMNARSMLAEEGGLDRFATHGRRWYALSDDEKVAIARGRLAIKTPALTKDAEEMWLDVISDHSKPAHATPVVIEGTATVEASDTMEPMQVEVTKDGPWDFNDTFPAPDAEQVGRLVVEGRSPFDAETPEEVVSILTETMAEAEEHAAAIEAWSAEIDKINAGGKPGFTVPKGKSAIDVATENLATATQALEDTTGAVADVWGAKAADAFKAEAKRRGSTPSTKLPVSTPFTGLPGADSPVEAKSGKVARKTAKRSTDEQRPDQGSDQGQLDFGVPRGAVDPAGRGDAERPGDGRGAGDQGGQGADAGPEQAGGLVGDPGRISDAAPDQRVGEASPNFIISDDFALGEGSDGQKLEANLAALRLVKTLDAENRYATPDEQAVLARWVGWGGLKTLFDEKHAGTTTQWGRGQAELKSILTKDEYYAAMRSTSDAHYTSRTVVKAMWEAMRRFGFTGGRALEPTIGSGNFLGLQPADLSGSTEWYASELDPITGRIAKHLYPRATVFDGMGFQDAPFRRDTVDIAIGNPPFGGDDSRVGNKAMHPDLGRMKVHNFVIAKTGQILREGGIMGMVVTHRFLDSLDAEARAVLAPNYRFIGAIRLPNTAFKANAGTEVTTDIVFFQKLRFGDDPGDQTWLETGATGPNGATMNAWFAQNPDMILGRPAMDGTMYGAGRDRGGEFTVHDDGRDLGQALTEAVSKLNASLPSRVQQLEDAVTAPQSVSTLAYGEMMLSEDGRIFIGDNAASGARIINEVTRETFWKDNAKAQADLVESLRGVISAKGDPSLEQVQAAKDAAVAAGLMDLAGDPLPAGSKFEQAMSDAIPRIITGVAKKTDIDALETYAKRVDAKRLGDEGFERLSGLLDLRNKMKALIRAEKSDSPGIEQMRTALRGDYNAFVKRFGFLNNSKNEAILRGDVGPEMALEVKYKAATKDGRPESAEPAPILEKRVMFPYRLPENVDEVSDAVHISMQERGYIDPDLVAALTKKAPAEVIAELTGGVSPLAFLNPATEKFELAEIYLSGNLAEKIAKAQEARAYEHIPHLKAAMPAPKKREQITPSIRSMWIPRDVFEDFIRALGYRGASVGIMEKISMVAVAAEGYAPNDFGKQFETDRMKPAEIFEHALKGKIPVVFDTIRENGSERRIKNEEATKEAVAAYERMTSEFPEWVYANPLRAEKVVDAFNTKVNVVTPRKYEGTRYLRTVGTSPNVELRNSQKNGAWRMIQDRMVLLHHVVGAGKTMTGITGVMERKRMGLSRKAVVVVPNHLTGQWGKEWLELYPAANILVPTEKDFDPSNRAKLINRIATGDFDAVIIGHSQLVKISNDTEIEEKYIGEEMDALNDVLQEQKKSGESKRTVSQIGKRINKLKEKLQKLADQANDRRDSGLLSWKELGVDYMVLDEAQEFKNLEYSTSATQLVGMNDPNGSQKAFDLLMKIRSLQDSGGGVTFMTGTPISNSLVEIYSVMKYLIPDSLESMGIKHFDAWKAAFIQDESRFEYTASMQLKERNVMAGMVNLGPLAELYRTFADIVMRPDVERMYQEQMEAKNAAQADTAKHVSTRFPTPRVKGGKRRILLAPPTARMEEFTRYLVKRMAGIKAAPDKKKYAKTDNPLWVLTDARKASVDIRTIDPEIGREEGSKVTRSADEIFRIWKANADRRGAQMVFSDMSTPSKNAEKDAKAILKDALARIGKKPDEIRRILETTAEMKAYSARWSEVVGKIEEMISSPDTDDAKRDALQQWSETPAVRDAAAAMFTADSGFSFYDDLRAILVEKGIPEAEIAFIHDYDTTIKKKELFEAVNEGKVRVLIGSTMKMGAGTNAQRRLVALHHIDAPWRPSDMEQREGRIIRQGNLFYEQDPDGFEVEILAYSTEKTSDVVQWQVLERKAKAIETFLNAAADALKEEGSDADQYAEFMAQSTGKKVFLNKMQAEKALIRARGAISSALRSRSEAQRFLAEFDEWQKNLKDMAAAFKGFGESSFPAGATDYLAQWRADIAAYRAERDRVDAANEEIRKRNVGKARKDWERLIPDPNAPKRWQTRPTNAWEAKVYDALEKATKSPNEWATIKLDGGHVVSVKASPFAGDENLKNFVVALSPVSGGKNSVIYLSGWAGIQSKDFRNSDKLLAAFDPAGAIYSAEAFTAEQESKVKSHAAMKPQMEEIAAKKIDETKVQRLQTALASLTAEARIEEVKYAEESAKFGSNHFVEIDTKGRNLNVESGDKPLTGQFQFTNAGRQYASEWAAPGGSRRIPGTDKFGSVAYFDASDMDSGDRAIVEAVKMPKEKPEDPDRWEVVDVHSYTEESDLEMRKPASADRAALDGEVEADPPITEEAIMLITRDMNAELARTGLAGKINVRVVRELYSRATGRRIYGRMDHDRRQISMEARGRDADGVAPIDVMRHEIIHALRSEQIWNRKGGLFTEAEWSELTAAARAEPEIVASVRERYPNLGRPGQVEEMVAELYRLWMANRDSYSKIERAMLKVEGFLTALANLLRGRGFVSAARVMEQIATGKIGRRGPQGPGGSRRQGGEVQVPPPSEMRGGALPGAIRSKFKGLVGSAHWKNPGEFVSSALTDRITAGDYSLLGMIPGRALYSEVAKKLASAKEFLRVKDAMDAERNEWHSDAAALANEWYEMGRKDPQARDEMHDLMHRATLSGVDPSKPDTWQHAMGKAAHEAISRHGDSAPKWAFDVISQIASHEKSYEVLSERYAALPKEFQGLFRKVLKSYDRLATEFEKAVADNIEANMRAAIKRAERAYQKEMDRIRDEGMVGDERDAAELAAKETLDAVKRRGGWGAKAKINALRRRFESNKLKGPYVPLARFGNYFVTIRDDKGAVVSFDMFETERKQKAFIRQMEAEGVTGIQHGLMDDSAALKEQVNPAFIADIEGLLSEAGASNAVMDAVWQRWLETLPSQSIRTSKIHRKGREGWNKDALRAYSHHLFHGSHQLVRLRHGIQLQEALEEAKEEARASDDPNRATAIVNEMGRRLDWIMNPTGSAWASWASGLTFVWYLGVSPAAALVNLSQTTVIGPAMMKARYSKASVTEILKQIGIATKDFSRGRGETLWDTVSAENAPGLSDAERAAIKAGYERGVIDRTQAHDLASVAESGVAFNPWREKWMRRFGWGFHHAERMNREVTYLAAYRLARAEGMNHDEAMQSAADLTWSTHFSYANSDRPRFMQKDWQKVIFGFKQYSVNLIWRLFRDAHQSLNGATAEERAEARTQLIGITLSMMAHAGIKGTWGYGILMMLLSVFFPGDEDDLEQWAADALLMEGDSIGVAAWNYMIGMALNGIPGQITGADLTSRIGSPNLWFRGDDRDLSNEEWGQKYLLELLGPTFGIFLSGLRGADSISEGNYIRGVEQATPKFLRDIIKAGRFAAEGVTTKNGDELIENVNPWEILMQANGFTPARISERYQQNNYLKNREAEIVDERKAIHRAATSALRDGEPIPESVMEKISDFNRRYPQYPITGDSIRQSLQARIRASERNEGGVALNPKLDSLLRQELAPSVY